MTAFVPDPTPRVVRPAYRSMWLASPVLATLAWALSGLGLAAWIWRRAPFIDDRPELPHTR